MLFLFSISLFIVRLVKIEVVAGRWAAIYAIAAIAMFFATFFWIFPPQVQAIQTGSITTYNGVFNSLSSNNIVMNTQVQNTTKETTDAYVPIDSSGLFMLILWDILYIPICIILAIKEFLDATMFENESPMGK